MQDKFGVGDFTALLKGIGVEKGDGPLIHSAFRGFNKSGLTPDGAIDALLEAVEPNEHLMFPTFTRMDDSTSDPSTSPCTTGILPETARKQESCIRSLHPSQSMTVFGPKARELTDDHLPYRAFGIGNPIDRFTQMGGKTLLLGVGDVANSTIHLTKEYAGTPKVPFQYPPQIIRRKLPRGESRDHQLDSSSSCSTGFGTAEYGLRRYGIIRDCFILNGVMIQLMRGLDSIRYVGELIQEKSDILLCTRPECRPSTGARKNLREMGKLPNPQFRIVQSSKRDTSKITTLKHREDKMKKVFLMLGAMIIAMFMFEIECLCREMKVSAGVFDTHLFVRIMDTID